MTPEPGERAQIRAAMDRILAGTPERSNGGLTVVALAIEAGVPRNALTQRHTDLKAEFYQRIKERGGNNEDEARLRAANAKLSKSLSTRARSSPRPGPTSVPSFVPSTSSPWKSSSSATPSPATAAAAWSSRSPGPPCPGPAADRPGGHR